MPLLPHQQRVIDERLELDSKRYKLETFMQTETCDALPDAERRLLQEQADVMSRYSEVLCNRILAFL